MFWARLCLWKWAAFCGLKAELLGVVCSNQAACFKTTLLLQRRTVIDEAVVDYLKMRRENCFWTQHLKSP